MPFIGNQPAESYASFETETFSVSATTNYTLSHAVTNENEIRLVINGVVQQPGSGKAYTASGTTLTLSSATASGDSMYAVYLGRALQTVNPPAASVGNSQTAPTIITGQTAETSIATDDLILLSDTSASGALKKMTRANFVSGIGGTNTPAFSVTLSGTQSCSHNTSTVIVFNSEHYDTDSAYDTSNGRFTVPSGEGGKYAFFVSLRFDQTTSNRNAVDIRINNSSNTQQVAFENAGPQYTTIGGAVSINLSAGDYVYAEYYQSSGGTIDVRTDSHFSGFKLI